VSYRIETNNLNIYFDESQVLKDVGIKIHKNTITAIIGPSGCGI